MYKMTVDFPNLAKGAEVQIDGLGIFENGYEHTVEDDQAQDFRNSHSTVEEEHDEEGNVISHTTVPGPTIVQAFKNTEGITVIGSKARGKSKANDPPLDEEPLHEDDKTLEGGAS